MRAEILGEYGQLACCDSLAPRRHKLLPLHFNFCRTTLKNEAWGRAASGSVFFALRMVTIDPRSTCIGLRPSSVRNTGYSGSVASISIVELFATIIDRFVRTCGQIGVITKTPD